MKLVDGSYVHESAQIYGDVTLAPGVSIWPCAVIRAEAHAVEIGEGTNIQDFVLIHVGFQNGTVVGSNCSITHRATLHGCTIADNVLIGIGATVMDGCCIGANSIVAGHSFLRDGTIVPENSIVMGVPAAVVKTRNNEVANRINALMYSRNAAAYCDGNFRLWDDGNFLKEIAKEEARLGREAR
jgi:carbonic anhydrase/acetyltransferase-like protein (isoleucine patch superfamily)